MLPVASSCEAVSSQTPRGRAGSLVSHQKPAGGSHLDHLRDEEKSIIESLKRLEEQKAAAAALAAPGPAKAKLAELELQAQSMAEQIERTGNPGAAVVGTSYFFALLGLLGTVLAFATITPSKPGKEPVQVMAASVKALAIHNALEAKD